MSQIENARLHGEQVRDVAFRHVFAGPERVAIITAAPGSGKSTSLLNIAIKLLEQDGVQRIAIAAQTNNQATDLAIKLADLLEKANKPADMAIRFASELLTRPKDFKGRWVTKTDQVQPAKDAIVISTASKWGQAIAKDASFRTDFVLVDEAYQMAWATFMQVSCLGARFILIGDEGQIDPVVPVDASRWDVATFPPQWPAPKVLQSLGVSTYGEDYLRKELEYCWRLPYESIEFIEPFYERLGLHVKPVAQAGDRSLTFGQAPQGEHAKVLNMMADGAPTLVTLPSAEVGSPLDADLAVAKAIAQTLHALLVSQPSYQRKDKKETSATSLKLSDIAICSTKRAMNSLIENEIQSVIKQFPSAGTAALPNYGLRVDTPERLQGLEFKVVLVVHPLSTALRPTEFDLATGRLCVMASRHEVALAIFSREHILTTLDCQLPQATQSPSLADAAGEGHKIHREFIGKLRAANRVIGLGK